MLLVVFSNAFDDLEIDLKIKKSLQDDKIKQKFRVILCFIEIIFVWNYLRIVSILRQRPTNIPVSPAITTHPNINPGRKSGASISSMSEWNFLVKTDLYFILN